MWSRRRREIHVQFPPATVVLQGAAAGPLCPDPEGVSVREREGLVGRIMHMRHRSAEPAEPAPESADSPGHDELRTLEARIKDLEQLVEGLQDSVHRESTRLGKRIGDVEARIQPAALGKALSDDARERGL
jgi:hypothetical protein